jgi:regulatory protein
MDRDPYISNMAEEKQPKKITDPAVALTRIESWCAYQERCQQEVRDKLYQWGMWPDAVENIIAELISRNFLNEERFAVAYAGGKFRIKKWGRQKIKMELKKRRVPDAIIRKALKEIGEEDYGNALEKTLAAKWKAEKEPHPLKKKMKVMRFMLSRGYETDAVMEAISKYTKA